MKRVLLLSLFVIALASCRKQPATLYILETTDLHGEMGASMASAAGYIEQARKEYGDGLILLDCGDVLQSSPEVCYSDFIDTTSMHIYSQIYNWLQYDAVAVGNHDFEAGKSVYKRVYSHVDMPVLCANIVYTRSNKPLFKPYTVLHRNGYKIAVLGLVNPASLEWLVENYRDGVSVTDMKESAAYWVRHIYRKENPDVLIGLFHTGNGKSETFPAAEIVESVPGIDLVCCGHVHRAEVNTAISPAGDSVTIMEAGSHADHIAKAKILINPNVTRKPTLTVSAEMIDTKDLPQDKKFVDFITPFIDRAKQYYDRPVCTIDSTICSTDVLNGPSAWVDLLHRSYLQIAANMGFEPARMDVVSFASPSLRDACLNEGQLTVRDFILLYPRENTISVVEMTGQEILQYLEYSYDLAISDPDGSIYNFDSAGGIVYTVDSLQPFGSRVTIVKTAGGNRFFLDRRYPVVMSTFRAMGGGSHLGEGLGWSYKTMSRRVMKVSDKPLRDMLIDLYSGKEIDATPINTWRYL